MAGEPTGAGQVTGATPAAGATPATTPAPEPTPATGTGSPSPEPPPATGAAPVEPLEPDAAGLGEVGQRLLAEARKAAKEADKRAKAAETALKAKEEAELSEAQKKDRRLAELEQEREAWVTERQRVYLTASVVALVPKLGLVDVDAVTRLIDRDALTFDENGQPTNTEEQVRALLRSKPYLGGGRPQPAPGIGATEGTSGTPPPSLTADELAAAQATGMSAERYAALKGVRTIDEWQATRRAATPPSGQH